MIKWIFCICCFFPFGGWSQAMPDEAELDIIEKKIQVLKESLHQDQLKEMKEEVKGQKFMIADWKSYAQELEKIRKQEKEDEEIRLQIKKMEERKARLIQPQSQPK